MFKYIILLTLLFIAAIYDAKTGKIPNILIAAGLLLSLPFFSSWKTFLYAVLAIILIFFIGMLHIMGMGDLKLWMVITAYTGFLHSLYILGGAALLLILYGFITNKKESFIITKYVGFSILLKEKMKIIEQKKYAFAPFLFISACIYAVILLL